MPLIAKLVAMLALVETTEVITQIVVKRGKRNEPVEEKVFKRKRVTRLQIVGGKAREEQGRLNLSAMRIQMVVRGRIGREVARDRREYQKSVKLQQFVRMKQAKQKLRILQHEDLLRSCAAAIQMVVRGHLGRVWFSSFLRRSLPYSQGHWPSAAAALVYQRGVVKRYDLEPERVSTVCEVCSTRVRVLEEERMGVWRAGGREGARERGARERGSEGAREGVTRPSCTFLSLATLTMAKHLQQYAYFAHVQADFEGAATLYAKALVVAPKNATLLYSASVFYQAHLVDSENAAELLQRAFRCDPRRSKHRVLEQMYFGRWATFQKRSIVAQLHFAVFAELVLRDFGRARSVFRSMFDLLESGQAADDDLVERVKSNYKRLKDAMRVRKTAALKIQSFLRGLHSQSKLMTVLGNESRQRRAKRIIETSQDAVQRERACFIIHFLVLNTALARELYVEQGNALGMEFMGEGVVQGKDAAQGERRQASIEAMRKAIHEGCMIHEGTAREALALMHKAKFHAMTGDREVAAGLYQEAKILAVGRDLMVVSEAAAQFEDGEF